MKHSAVTKYAKQVQFLAKLIEDNPQYKEALAPVLLQWANKLSTTRVVMKRTLKSAPPNQISKRKPAKKTNAPHFNTTSDSVNKLYEAFKKNPKEALDAPKLAQHLNMPKSNFYKALNFLLADGFIEKVAVGKYKLKE